MINRWSHHLVIVVGTYNRLMLLRRLLASIAAGTSCDHEVVVIDAGSTDGTVEYLRAQDAVTPVFQGERPGITRAYNRVLRQLDARYVGFMSDDSELVPGSFDLAVSILDAHPGIGLVGLKMRDTQGEGARLSYMGGMSEYGILTATHAFLRMDVLRAIGYFNERYHSYGLDPDLTASVLCAGYRVVITKHVAVLHHRAWVDDLGEEKERSAASLAAGAVYQEKFAFLDRRPFPCRLRSALGRVLGAVLFFGRPPGRGRLGIDPQDWRNLRAGCYISLVDPWRSRHRPFYLEQRLPRGILLSPKNPYHHLVR